MSRALQASKIREIGKALTAVGYLELDDQADALGLCRSTTWAVMQANYKHSGLTAGVIMRMLDSGRLPDVVRSKVLEYVDEKLSCRYGHSAKQLLHFSRRLSALQDSGAARFDSRVVVTRKHKTNQLSGIEPFIPTNTG